MKLVLITVDCGQHMQKWIQVKLYLRSWQNYLTLALLPLPERDLLVDHRALGRQLLSTDFSQRLPLL